MLEPAPRRFQSRPAQGDDFVKRFLEHVKQTGQPETFAGLYTDNLEKDEEFFIIAPITIKRLRRPDGDCAPCPMCHHRNRYLDGRLVYLPRLKAVAAIGNECAAAERVAAANREYQERTDRQREEDYLLPNLPVVTDRLACLASLRPRAQQARDVFRKFRTEAGDFQKRLRRIKQQGGQLAVTEVLKRARDTDDGDTDDGDAGDVGPRGFKGRGSSAVDTRDIGFGQLVGGIAVTSDFNPVAEIDRLVADLQPHAGAEDEEQALDRIAAMGDAERKWAYASLMAVDRKYRKLCDRLADFWRFFDADNVERIRQWGAHSSQPAPFSLYRADKADMIVIVWRQGRDSLWLPVPKQIAPPYPPWPMPADDQDAPHEPLGPTGACDGDGDG